MDVMAVYVLYAVIIKGKQLSSGKVWWKLVELRFIVVVTMKRDVA
jgi:hypothetical protein